MNIDTLKAVGLLLLGVGILLIGIVSMLIYLKLVTYEHKELFLAFCKDGFIKIKAYKDLHNVLVIYDNKTICKYPFIKEGSSRICDIRSLIRENITVFLIKTGEGEDVVECFNEIIIRKIP